MQRKTIIRWRIQMEIQRALVVNKITASLNHTGKTIGSGNPLKRSVLSYRGNMMMASGKT